MIFCKLGEWVVMLVWIVCDGDLFIVIIIVSIGKVKWLCNNLWV